MPILCNLQNMNLAFGEKVIFKDAKLTINQGDRIGLIGLNGQGKSTLFNILAQKVTPDISKPPFIFDRNNELFTLFYIPQELDIETYPELDIENFYLSFYPHLYKIHKELSVIQKQLLENYESEELIHKQQELLEMFEAAHGWELESSYLNYLNHFDLQERQTPVHKLSGGEQKKIALSIGLSSKANLILWDEPTNHLDVETIEKFEDELSNSQATYMIISHDRYLLNHVTNKIIHIERGSINSFEGTYLEYLEYLEEREKELAKNLDKLENQHRRELAWMRQGIKARGTRSKKRVEGFHNIKSDIQKLKERSRKVVNLNLAHSGRKSKQLIQIKEGEFYYQDEKIFENLNLGVYRGDKIALIGPNGAGKTTLISLLSQKLPLKGGSIKSLEGLKVHIFDQKRDALDLEKTPFSLIGDGQDFVHLPNGSKKHVISYLEDYLFAKEQVHRPIYTLSGGEKNRLQLALFMKNDADLWVFDEPTNDLDIETIELLEKEIANYNAAVIIIGHDRAFLDNTCNTTWLVHDHNIEIFEGGYSQVAPYLHALELEKKLPQVENDKSNHPPKSSSISSPTGPTNKEKIRWETVESDILNTETTIEQIKQKMTEMDFTKQDPQKLTQFNDLQQQLDQAETTLTKLYTEWERLSKKMD